MSPIVAKLLEDRGITAADLEFFLQPTIDKLAKPEELPGIVEAAELILDSVVYRRKIVVFGDYDCDGICATAIVSRTLRALGGSVSEFIPNRLTEGYGMNAAAVKNLADKGVGLIITVDNGIALIAVVGRGMVKSKGVAARVFGAVSGADVNIRMIDQGSCELNIILGVDVADFEKAIGAIYHEFVK